jgi:CheY-like chemotaxis protein
MILIVEDDPVSRRALQYLLASRGYTSQAVSSAEEALELLRPLSGDGARSPMNGVEIAAVATGTACAIRPPEMVLIDVDLPGISGIELLRELQATHPRLACMLMSAHHEELRQREAAHLDAMRVAGTGGDTVPFLPKPLDFQKLMMVVREHA